MAASGSPEGIRVSSVGPVAGSLSLGPGSAKGARPSRLFSIFMVVSLVLVVLSTATQAWVVFVVVPQQIRDSEPVVIDQAYLLSNGPSVGCFSFLSGTGAVVHQGESFVLSWNVMAPSNALTSCTVRSVDWLVAPTNAFAVIANGTNLPVTVLAGQVGVVQIGFAPLNFPFWGSLTVVVTETSP